MATNLDSRYPKAHAFMMELDAAKTEAELRAVGERAFQLIFQMENSLAGMAEVTTGLRERLRRLHAGLPEFAA